LTGARIASARTLQHPLLVRTRLLAPARRTALLPAAAAVTLLAGYADLVAGGLTIAPVLLAASYLVLVPAALLRS
jgi:hypothetical protein